MTSQQPRAGPSAVQETDRLEVRMSTRDRLKLYVALSASFRGREGYVAIEEAILDTAVKRHRVDRSQSPNAIVQDLVQKELSAAVPFLVLHTSLITGGVCLLNLFV